MKSKGPKAKQGPRCGTRSESTADAVNKRTRSCVNPDCTLNVPAPSETALQVSADALCERGCPYSLLPHNQQSLQRMAFLRRGLLGVLTTTGVFTLVFLYGAPTELFPLPTAEHAREVLALAACMSLGAVSVLTHTLLSTAVLTQDEEQAIFEATRTCPAVQHLLARIVAQDRPLRRPDYHQVSKVIRLYRTD